MTRIEMKRKIIAIGIVGCLLLTGLLGMSTMGMQIGNETVEEVILIDPLLDTETIEFGDDDDTMEGEIELCSVTEESHKIINIPNDINKEEVTKVEILVFGKAEGDTSVAPYWLTVFGACNEFYAANKFLSLIHI